MKAKYLLLLLLLLLFFLCFSCALFLKQDKKIIKDVLFVGVRSNFTINAGTEFLLSVANLTLDLADFPPRVSIECLNCFISHPAFISFRQNKGITSIELPFRERLDKNYTLHEVEKTLYPFNKFQYMTDNKKKNKLLPSKSDNDYHDILEASLFTLSPENVTVSLLITIVKDFVLKLNENKKITITPYSPAFYYYKFSNNPDELSVIVKVESEISNCMVLSIQNVSYPVAESEGKCHNCFYQTVITIGALTATHSDFPLGFFAAFSFYTDNSYCSNEKVQEFNRSKEIVFSVTKTLSAKYFSLVIFGTLIALFIFFVIMNLLFYFCFMRPFDKVPELEEYLTNSKYEPSTSTPIGEASEERKLSNSFLSPIHTDTLSIKSDSSLDETEVDVLTDIEQDKNIFRAKITLCVSDLAKKNPNVLEKKSKLYFWLLITVFLFYGAPSFQLVLTYQDSIRQFGNTDLCYFNFLCSHPLGYFMDFNHFFSNISYVFLGILFIIITHRKESMHNKLMCQNDSFKKHYGVPQHFGLFYAMGASLIFEGLLSACYHICPNINNFQFDASFMYMISTLCMIKIYQSRHPDVNATAYSTFFLMGIISLMDLIGNFIDSEHYLYLTFFMIHVGIVFHISLQIYYVGRFTINLKVILRFFKEFSFSLCRNHEFWRPLYPARFGMLSLINICNWFIAIYGFLLPHGGFSSYLLIVFISNLMLYTAFYIIMKIFSKEKILPQTQLIIFLAFFTWIAALYFFYYKTITWKKTPAESRTYNKPCVLFEFYDNHDIWHFLSSIGLFFSFLVLLTLDDDLIFVNRCKIPVF